MPINNCTAEQSEYLFRVSGSKVIASSSSSSSSSSKPLSTLLSALWGHVNKAFQKKVWLLDSFVAGICVAKCLN